MMFEKFGLRCVARPLFKGCLTTGYLVCFWLVAFAASGCASGSETARGAEADEKVAGEAPSPDEDTPKSLPDGPDVEVGSARTSAGDQQEATAGANSDDGDDAEAAFTRSEVQTFMEKGPSYALTVVRVEPKHADGEFQGFEIVEMQPEAAEVVDPQLGTGDVITHINGVRMQKPDDYLNAWKLLGEVSKVRIDFMRDGASERAVWQIR